MIKIEKRLNYEVSDVNISFKKHQALHVSTHQLRAALHP